MGLGAFLRVPCSPSPLSSDHRPRPELASGQVGAYAVAGRSSDCNLASAGRYGVLGGRERETAGAERDAVPRGKRTDRGSRAEPRRRGPRLRVPLRVLQRPLRPTTIAPAVDLRTGP